MTIALLKGLKRSFHADRRHTRHCDLIASGVNKKIGGAFGGGERMASESRAVDWVARWAWHSACWQPTLPTTTRPAAPDHRECDLFASPTGGAGCASRARSFSMTIRACLRSGPTSVGVDDMV